MSEADKIAKSFIKIVGDKDATISRLTEENERLKRELAQLKCNFAPIKHFAEREQEKKGEPATVKESDGCPIEGAVLKREWRQLTADLAAARKVIEGVRECFIWMDGEPFYRTENSVPQHIPSKTKKAIKGFLK